MEDIERVYALIPGASYRLEVFLNRHEINDLHDGNFGRRAGEYVIMDFSGYCINFKEAA